MHTLHTNTYQRIYKCIRFCFDYVLCLSSYYLATKESQSLSQAVEESDSGAFNRVVTRAKEMLKRQLQQQRMKCECVCVH